jgi:hypothetical protein
VVGWLCIWNAPTFRCSQHVCGTAMGDSTGYFNQPVHEGTDNALPLILIGYGGDEGSGVRRVVVTLHS